MKKLLLFLLIVFPLVALGDIYSGGIGSGSGSGSFDGTAEDNVTWSDGANATNTWTFDVSGLDHTMAFGDGMVTFSNVIAALGNVQLSDRLFMTPDDTGAMPGFLNITPSAAIDTAGADYDFITLLGDALDPSAVGTEICGLSVEFGGISETNLPNIKALKTILPAGSNSHALDIDQGQIHQDYATGSDAGATYIAHEIIIDVDNLSATSTVAAIDIAIAEGTPAGEVVGIEIHSNIVPIKQTIGAFSSASQTEYAGRRTTGGTVWADGIDTVEIFVVDDDEILIGDATVFSEVEFVMTSAGTKSVEPLFYYNTAADAWTQFFPEDPTDGFQQNGTIEWELDDISGTWTGDGDPGAADTSAGYWIRIVRTRNADPGTPTPTTAKTGVVTNYEWDKDGNISSNALVTNSIDGNGAVDIDVGSADITDVTITTDGGIAIIDGSYQFPDADGSPSVAGELQYDNTVTGFIDGMLTWYDDDAVRYIVDIDALPTVTSLVSYNPTNDEFETVSQLTLQFGASLEFEGATADDYEHTVSVVDPVVDVTTILTYNKVNATVSPAVTNDLDEGFSVGSLWGDTTNDNFFICLDATDGAAVWQRIGSDLRSLAVADLGDTTTPSVLTIFETANTVISNYKSSGADHVFTMPAAHINGNIIFVIGDEFQIDIEPNTGDLFYLNGTAMAANEHIQNTADTLGDTIVGIVVNINATLRWMFSSDSANFVEETP